MKTHYRILVLLLMFCASVQGMQASLNRLFTTGHNLPNSLVNCVVEDAEEMIWVSTEDGLCRFNGSQFVNYRNEPGNPHSLQSNFVRNICCDSLGHVLVCTLQGVQMYRRQTDDFTPVLCNTDVHVSPGNISGISLLANGDFLATGNRTFTVHIDENDQPQVVGNAFTQNVGMTLQSCQDALGNIWVIRSNDGIFCLDPSGNLRELLDNGHSYCFTTLGLGPDGSVYAGGLERGLYRYNRANDRFEEVTRPSDHFMVKDLCPLPGTNQMFIATDGEGIKVLDCSTLLFTPYLLDDAQIEAETQKVQWLCLSRQGDLWMALYQKGLFVATRNALDFRYYGPASLRYNCVGDRCVTSLLRGRDGLLWVGTDNDGLYGVSDKGTTLAHHKPLAMGGSLPQSIVRLFEDSQGHCWCGSYRQGGGIVDLQTGRFNYVPIQGLEGMPTNIYDFAEDRQGRIWVASMGNGVLRYNPSLHVFERQATLGACDWSGAISYEPVTDCLYVGTYNGLVVIDLKRDSISCQQYVPDAVVYSVTRTGDGKMLLSSNLGLIAVDIRTHELQTFTTADGLANNNVYAAQVDADGNYWMSSTSGLTKYNRQQGIFTNYSVRDGLQCSEFYKNASLLDADGTLWFGGTSGITWFRPHEIQQEAQTAQVRIVSFGVGQDYAYPDADGVYRLSSADHSFSIELAARPILSTYSVGYRYSLDDDHWQTLPAGTNRVSFSGISSGSHTFSYQLFGDGYSSDVVQTTIFIARPWYRQWWSVLLWLLIAVLIICLFVLRTRRNLYERKLRRKHEQEVAINEGKLQFFMNIAHEFRTPMTLVVAPLQKLINTDKDPKRQRAYQTIDRNANRVLELINELMDLRKIDKAQMKLQCRKVAPSPILRDLCDSVRDLSDDHELTLTLHDQLPEGLMAWIDQVCFEKIVLNLLSNAIKYTPHGGSIDVEARLTDDRRLQIAVVDTGIGIAPQDRIHIFERFYEVRHSATSSLGTGIGLNLVHALMHLHHGQITVAANPAGQGTVFTISLPIDDSFYPQSERFVEKDDATEPELERTVTDQDIIHSTLRQDLPVADTAPSGRQCRHVLVVDDDDEVRTYLQNELRAYYRVSVCTNGREALEHLLAEPADLVLSDVMMPEMDGIQLCLRIRSNVLLNHLPVVLLTAKASDEDRLESLEVGANAFISKPFNMEILQKTIQNLLAEHDRLRSSFSGQQLPVDQVNTPEMLSPDERLLQRIVKIVNDNLSNPDLTSEMIADEVGLSRVHLYRKLKELTHQSARNYIRNIRLAKAAELLSGRKMAIAEVAYQVGFSNPNNFATAFKEMYGVSPTVYNEQHCNS